MLTGFLDRLPCSMHQSVAGIARIHQFSKLRIGLSVGLGIGYHVFDIVVTQTARCCDANRLLFARGLVFRRHLQNTIGIKIESHLDLRRAAPCWGDVGQIEATQ